MKPFSKARLLLYVALLGAMIFSGIQLGRPTPVGAVACCSFGEDCTIRTKTGGTQQCCYPGINQAPCSQNKPNYCKDSCD